MNRFLQKMLGLSWRKYRQPRHRVQVGATVFRNGRFDSNTSYYDRAWGKVKQVIIHTVVINVPPSLSNSFYMRKMEPAFA